MKTFQEFAGLNEEESPNQKKAAYHKEQADFHSSEAKKATDKDEIKAHNDLEDMHNEMSNSFLKMHKNSELLKKIKRPVS